MRSPCRKSVCQTANKVGLTSFTAQGLDPLILVTVHFHAVNCDLYQWSHWRNWMRHSYVFTLYSGVIKRLTLK